MEHKSGEGIVVFGATSAVAQALARLHAAAGDSLLLVGRNEQRLQDLVNDLGVRSGQDVQSLQADLAHIDGHPDLVNTINERMDNVSKYYFFHGILPDQQHCERSWAATFDVLNTNFLSIASLLTLIANRVSEESNRSLVIVSSVAGDRGRQSNYVYGTSKGALNTFLEGLRNRLHKHGCHVMTVKPGFIDTPMTAAFSKQNFMWATPEKVASDIYKAANKRKDQLYTPWFWRYIMFVIRHLPEPIFKRLDL
ncbi:MAG: SDR family oxidoreductase [Gammaproteobacteria bacterium]|nr:SDR family oxidoreductase [Gammaproteobacteria bacterium]